MYTVLAVELRVELLFPADPFAVKEYRRTLGAGRNVAQVIDHDHDRGFLIHLSFRQLWLLSEF